MSYQVPFQILKPSTVSIFYGLSGVAFLHIYKGKIKNLFLAIVSAMFTSFLISMFFYDLNPFIWFKETQSLGIFMIKEIRGGILSMISVATFLTVFMTLPKLITERLAKQELRSFYHLAYGIMIVYFLYLNSGIAFFILTISLSIFIFLEYIRKSDSTEAFTLFIKKAINKAVKGQEVRGYMATFFYLIGLIIVVLFLNPTYAIGCTLILALGDPTAVMIGRRFGKHKWGHNPNKSLEGSISMFVVVLITLQLVGIPRLTTIFASAGATLFESLRIEIGDNLIIPIISGIIMVAI